MKRQVKMFVGAALCTSVCASFVPKVETLGWSLFGGVGNDTIKSVLESDLAGKTTELINELKELISGIKDGNIKNIDENSILGKALIKVIAIEDNVNQTITIAKWSLVGIGGLLAATIAFNLARGMYTSKKESENKKTKFADYLKDIESAVQQLPCSKGDKTELMEKIRKQFISKNLFATPANYELKDEVIVIGLAGNQLATKNFSGELSKLFCGYKNLNLHTEEIDSTRTTTYEYLKRINDLSQSKRGGIYIITYDGEIVKGKKEDELKSKCLSNNIFMQFSKIDKASIQKLLKNSIDDFNKQIFNKDYGINVELSSQFFEKILSAYEQVDDVDYSDITAISGEIFSKVYNYIEKEHIKKPWINLKYRKLWVNIRNGEIEIKENGKEKKENSGEFTNIIPTRRG